MFKTKDKFLINWNNKTNKTHDSKKIKYNVGGIKKKTLSECKKGKNKHNNILIPIVSEWNHQCRLRKNN